MKFKPIIKEYVIQYFLIFFFSLLVPSVGPSIINGTRTSGTTASLLWVPLSIEDSRGFVVNYTVKYSQKSDILCSPPNTWTNATDLITHDVLYVVSGLLPHISYCVVVSANTNAGAGVYGPPLEIPRELFLQCFLVCTFMLIDS